MMSVSSSTRLACLLGHPVAHSVSPQILAAAFAEADVDAVYLAFDVPPADLGVAVAGLRALGMLGANLTVPHKLDVLDHADGCTPECEAVGAANTLYWEGERLIADNTDAGALVEVLRNELVLAPGTVAVVFGAGGAARAAAVALARCGAAVRVEARRSEAAEEVQALAERLGARRAGEDERAALVVNATPLGLHGEPLPEPYMNLRPGQAALDLLYGVVPTPFLRAAMDAGIPAVDGLPMLVAQAALAFERWTGETAPRAAMRTAAERGVGRF